MTVWRTSVMSSNGHHARPTVVCLTGGGEWLQARLGSSCHQTPVWATKVARRCNPDLDLGSKGCSQFGQNIPNSALTAMGYRQLGHTVPDSAFGRGFQPVF